MNKLLVKVKKEFIHVDEWMPQPEDILFKTTKGWMIVPLVGEMYGLDERNSICNFILSPKKGYNMPKIREHLERYINYFEKFYDEENELVFIYGHMKFIMDCYITTYSEEAFIYDICKFFLSRLMQYKINKMNVENYKIHLNPKKNSSEIWYDDTHGRILMKLCLMMNLIIPLASHYIHCKRIGNSKDFLLKLYDTIISKFRVDIYNKLYETATYTINSTIKDNPLWKKQDIRGINPALHATDSVENIILNIIPKYDYSRNMAVLNLISIRKNMKYKIFENTYEFEFNELSSSNRDEEMLSDFDKFENTLSKASEDLYLQNGVNCKQTMKQLSYQYPIEKDEIIFYVINLMRDNKFIMNPFQKKMVFYEFYKDFGDVVSIRSINRTDFIKLVIIAKRRLINQNLKLLPYILGGKVDKLVEKKDVNARQLLKIESSETWLIIKNKYKNFKLEEEIRSIIATILASEFSIIDYYNKQIHGLKIELLEDYIIEETLIMCSMI